MKRLLLCCALLMTILGAVASAQISVRVVDTIYARTENKNDPPLRLRFGIDPTYTDTIDGKGPEFELPAIPPSFYGAFRVPPRKGNSTYANADIRNVPDSIASGAVLQSSVLYLFDVFRSSAEGSQLYLEFPRFLTQYVDSVNILDAVTDGVLVNHTFTKEGGSLQITNDGLNSFWMRVYFNFTPPSIVRADDSRPHEIVELAISPNPVRGSERIALRNAVPAGARLLLTDMRGEQTELARIEEESAGLQVDLPRLTSGVYMVRLVGADGTLLRSGRLMRID